MFINLSVSTDTIPTSMASSIVYDGETYTLDASHPVGTFEDGSPFIVSTSGGQITNTTTNSSTVNGAIANGMMKNPCLSPRGSSELQGFDAWFGEAYDNAGNRQTLYDIPYSASLNVDPGGADTATWTAGEKASFVKSFRASGKTTVDAQFTTVEKYHVITILDAAPPLRTIRPGMAGTTKTLRQAPASFTPRGVQNVSNWGTVASMIAKVPPELCIMTDDYVKVRYYRLDALYDAVNNDGYSAKFIPRHMQMVYALNTSAASSSEQSEIINRIIKFANDIDELIGVTGTSYFDPNDGTAGQGAGIWSYLMLASILCDDSSLRTLARTGNFQPDTACYYVTAGKVDEDALVENGRYTQTYFDEHVGKAEAKADDWGSNSDARYNAIAQQNVSYEILGVISMAIGQGAYTDGWDTILEGGALSSSNEKSAPLAVTCKYRSHDPNPTISYQKLATWDLAWDRIIADGGYTTYTEAPEQPPNVYNFTNYFSVGSGDGEIDLDINGTDWATETVTQYDRRYSLDGYQWIENNNITLTSDQHTQSGLLLGAVYWNGWRQRSSSGTGIWVANYPENNGSTDDRQRVTTSGTGSALAPSYTGGTAPKIVHNTYTNWFYDKVCDQSPSGLVSGDEVFCGVGHPGNAAYPAPTYTYQWKRDGVNISGATSKGYTVVGADVGTDLTCEITATNASGSDTATTAAVSVA